MSNLLEASTKKNKESRLSRNQIAIKQGKINQIKSRFYYKPIALIVYINPSKYYDFTCKESRIC